jgi:flavodoxin
MKTIVAYFSATGTTAKAAIKIAEEVSADLYEIQPETPYTAADLDWQDVKSRSTLEMKDRDFRPPIADRSFDFSGYDTIYVGFPIWWYTAPTIINTFFEAYDLSGKKIILFATSGGSTIDMALRELSQQYPELDITEGKMAY